jgi:hypothetical protein
MCNPHKPGRDDEKARIEAANGWVSEESELYMARLHIMDLSDPLVRGKVGVGLADTTVIRNICFILIV